MTNEQTKPEIEQPETEEQHSRIVIEFDRPGDAEPSSIQFYAVTVGQVQVIAERLRMMAERQLLHKWAAIDREEMQKAAEMARIQQMIKGGVA